MKLGRAAQTGVPPPSPGIPVGDAPSAVVQHPYQESEQTLVRKTIPELQKRALEVGVLSDKVAQVMTMPRSGVQKARLIDLIMQRLDALKKNRKRGLLAAMGFRGLTPETAFQRFDTDRSGYLDTDEIKEAFHALGFHIDEATVWQVLDEMDKDGNGTVSFGEFLQYWESLKSDKKRRKDGQDGQRMCCPTTGRAKTVTSKVRMDTVDSGLVVPDQSHRPSELPAWQQEPEPPSPRPSMRLEQPTDAATTTTTMTGGSDTHESSGRGNEWRSAAQDALLDGCMTEPSLALLEPDSLLASMKDVDFDDGDGDGGGDDDDDATVHFMVPILPTSPPSASDGFLAATAEQAATTVTIATAELAQVGVKMGFAKAVNSGVQSAPQLQLQLLPVPVPPPPRPQLLQQLLTQALQLPLPVEIVVGMLTDPHFQPGPRPPYHLRSTSQPTKRTQLIDQSIWGQSDGLGLQTCKSTEIDHTILISIISQL